MLLLLLLLLLLLTYQRGPVYIHRFQVADMLSRAFSTTDESAQVELSRGLITCFASHGCFCILQKSTNNSLS